MECIGPFHLGSVPNGSKDLILNWIKVWLLYWHCSAHCSTCHGRQPAIQPRLTVTAGRPVRDIITDGAARRSVRVNRYRRRQWTWRAAAAALTTTCPKPDSQDDDGACHGRDKAPRKRVSHLRFGRDEAKVASEGDKCPFLNFILAWFSSALHRRQSDYRNFRRHRRYWNFRRHAFKMYMDYFVVGL